MVVLLLVGWAGYKFTRLTESNIEERFRQPQQKAESDQQDAIEVKRKQERQAEAVETAKRKAVADRVAAIQADPDRQAKAAALAKLPYLRSLRCKAAEGASDLLDFEVTLEQSDGLKGIRISTQGIEVSIREVAVLYVGLGEWVFHTIGGNFFVANNSTSGPLSVGNDPKPLSRVRLVYDGRRPPGSFVTPSLCIEGIKRDPDQTASRIAPNVRFGS